MEVAMKMHDDPPRRTVRSTEQARQGETSGHVRAILFVSMALAIAAGIGFFIYYQ
jgi:hypothetical protein